MIVLGLSTSTPRGSVALADRSGIRGQASYLEQKTHGERLFPLIDDVCARAGVRKEEITAIGCDVGPGSFTGVRVAVAAAHGMALALGVPTIGVPSLEAMAVAALRSRPSAARVVAVLDAYKGELFVGVFEPDGADGARAIEPLSHAGRDEVAAMLDVARAGGALIVGHVVALAPGAAAPAVVEGELPDAALVASLALRRLVAGPAPQGGLEPIYVRAPDARPAAAPDVAG